MLPEITSRDLAFCHTFNPDFLIQMLIVSGVLIWRAQISNSQFGIMEKEKIQSLPSMKYTAKLLNNNEFANKFIASVAVGRSSVYEAEEYQNLDLNQRNAFVVDRINDLAHNKIGDAKILTPRQISCPEYLRTHRRGLMASIRGIFSSTTLYHPASLIGGVNIAILNWLDFSTGFFQLANYSGIENAESLIWDWSKYNLPDFFECENFSTLDLLKIVFTYTIGNDVVNNLVFEDGIIVSKNDMNKLPFEEPIVISRNKPSFIKEIQFLGEENDPFLFSAAEQMRTIKKKERLFLETDKFLKIGKKNKNKNQNF